METQAWRIELELDPSRPDPVGDSARSALSHRGLPIEHKVRSGRGFLLPASLSRADVDRIASQLLADPVTERVKVFEPGQADSKGDTTLLVRRLPGVADPEADSARRALSLFDVKVAAADPVQCFRIFRVEGEINSDELVRIGSRALANPTIESAALGDQPVHPHPVPSLRKFPRMEVALREADDVRLDLVSKEMSLALSTLEMRAIQEFYVTEGREPTDVELETLAQTWSEHCKHKTLTGPVCFREFAADGELIRERNFANLLKETVFDATRKLSPEWCWSVFKDNAGVIAMTDEIGIAIKVETHNHPSALDPYGGAGTGIGGVIRDILGTGLGARPFAAIDVFCVGPKDFPRDQIPPGALHPDRVLEGVIAGVRDYGNRMGIPTVAGTVIRHPGYVANPLVFAGCVGEIPRDKVEKLVSPGDRIVSIGGRTGRDGIHGATFSSEALHEESDTIDSTAVQIGDPITEKKVLDVMIQARDRDLFSAVTDCGAGGFSSAVGEMGEDCGAEVELASAPLKYPGLSYWEVWISEAQERMVLAVPPAKLKEMHQLCDLHEVECTEIGSFTDTGRLKLTWHGDVVGDLPMEFLHGAVPQPSRKADSHRLPLQATAWAQEAPERDLLLKALAHPSCESKEWVVRQYDHEVQGGTVVKPYQGPYGRGPGDGTVVKPRLDLKNGVAIGCGIAPSMALLDSYAGTACAIDEAIRNVVAAGGNPNRTALLDNFCWGDCRKPDRLGSLVLAAEACYDASIAYGAPFVSGKDSLNNEYRVGDEETAIPPTLLATAIVPVNDTKRCPTTPLKKAGNVLLALGVTHTAGGGSVAAEILGLEDSEVPRPDFSTAPALFDALYQAIQSGYVASCHDLSEGGLGVGLAEMVLGSNLGCRVDLQRIPGADDMPVSATLFAETPTRFVLEISLDHLEAVAELFRTLPWSTVGEVQDNGGKLLIHSGDDLLHQYTITELLHANGASA
ncbi:MAG: phosphoribosylformylglycinamidine synthase subunit PurL [Planctomycetes bacterium]|nr:phosphoribosylformylglycinamidine synthase subunit PurL [Planctomycetota bacterium]